MKRSEILYSLESAQVAHAKWLGYGRQLVEGDNLENAQTPLKCTDCTFGQWFYSEWLYIKNIPGFKEIESLHKEFHELYEALYNVALQVHNSRTKRRLFASKKEKEQQLEQMNYYYKRLEEKSKRLLNVLQKVEMVVSAMSDRLFERNMKMNTQEPV